MASRKVSRLDVAEFRRAAAGTQLLLPIPPAPVSITDGLWLVRHALVKKRRLRQQRKCAAVHREQLCIRFAPPKDRRNTRAKYPIEMVLEARKMRRWEFTYTEIASALNEHFKTNVSWFTVRDWVQHWYRMKK